jgi:hypothetical protein
MHEDRPSPPPRLKAAVRPASGFAKGAKPSTAPGLAGVLRMAGVEAARPTKPLHRWTDHELRALLDDLDRHPASTTVELAMQAKLRDAVHERMTIRSNAASDVASLERVANGEIRTAALTGAERQARRRARLRGETGVPMGRPGRPRKAERSPMGWPEALRILGLAGDPQRVLDRTQAVASRTKADIAASERQVRDLASALQKARRREALATADWRQKPTSEALSELEATIRVRSLLESQLRDLCCADEGPDRRGQAAGSMIMPKAPRPPAPRTLKPRTPSAPRPSPAPATRPPKLPTK